MIEMGTESCPVFFGNSKFFINIAPPHPEVMWTSAGE
jgi:hypothetical protein